MCGRNVIKMFKLTQQKQHISFIFVSGWISLSTHVIIIIIIIIVTPFIKEILERI